MMWVQLGGSLAAVLALVGLARWLKLGESRLTDATRACEIAEEQLAGFVANRALLSEDGSSALVAGNGTVAVLKRHGAKVAVRRMIPPLVIREAIEGVSVDTGERLFGKVVLTGVIAEEVRSLETALTGNVVSLH